MQTVTPDAKARIGYYLPRSYMNQFTPASQAAFSEQVLLDVHRKFGGHVEVTRAPVGVDDRVLEVDGADADAVQALVQQSEARHRVLLIRAVAPHAPEVRRIISDPLARIR